MDGALGLQAQPGKYFTLRSILPAAAHVRGSRESTVRKVSRTRVRNNLRTHGTDTNVLRL